MLALISSTTTGCGETTKEINWREQVQLSTGEVIVVERGEKLNLVSEPGRGSGWLFDEAWLKARLPGIGETVWRGALSPLVLNVTPKGNWYLLGVTGSIRGEREYQLAEGKRYVAFELTDRSWLRVPFADFPEEFQPNLLADTYTPFIELRKPNGILVQFNLKAELDTDPTLGSALRHIDRSLGQ
jgi:hypothetical protein